jgi:hypothetical protein
MVSFSRAFSSVFLCAAFMNVVAQTSGCTDPLATNFNVLATQNDGSCTYATTNISPQTSVDLPGTLVETSGLIYFENGLLTHNDNSDISLYKLDTINGTILQTFSIPNVSNTDWEEISQDASHLFVGDFGNNVNGNRTDLHILRIEKASILSGNPIVDTIWFSYSNQTDFSPTGGNNTDFDCEALIVGTDSIFLFTKEWNTNGTAVYSLPKAPGTYVAAYKDHLAVGGLITGATYLEQKQLIVLSAYSSFLQPFIYLLYDFNGNDFFGGNKRKIGLNLPFHQIEGITTNNGEKYFLTNEAFSQATISVNQKMHTLDLSNYLGDYLHPSTAQLHEDEITETLVFPNPNWGTFSIQQEGNFTYTLYDAEGKILNEGNACNGETIEMKQAKAGLYQLTIQPDGKPSLKRWIKVLSN